MYIRLIFLIAYLNPVISVFISSLYYPGQEVSSQEEDTSVIKLLFHFQWRLISWFLSTPRQVHTLLLLLLSLSLLFFILLLISLSLFSQPSQHLYI